MAVSWHSFDLRSGKRGPQVAVRQLGTISRLIGAATDVGPLDAICFDGDTGTPVPEFAASVEPGWSMLVALDGDDERILWGGMVTRELAGLGITSQVWATTLERYFENRFVGDLTFTGVDQATICAGMVGAINADGLNFVIDAPVSPVVRDRTYADDEDKTVATALSELSGVIGGPEWTIDLSWTDAAHSQITRTFRVRDRLGTALANPVRFEYPGPVIDASYLRDYSPGRGANDVLATSSGEGDSRPESAHQTAANLLAAGQPRFEYRFTPSTSITETETLNEHAAERLSYMYDGLTQLKVSANLDAAPTVNSDWWLGDDITVALTSPRFPLRVMSDGRLGPGYERRVRVVGWAMDLDARIITPDTREYGEGDEE